MENQKRTDELWALKSQMIKLHNNQQNYADYEKVLEFIDTNLDSGDEQFLEMAIDCINLTKESFIWHKKLYISICEKYKGKQFNSIRTCIRVTVFERLVEENQ